MTWIIDHYIEILGAFFGFLFLYFEIKENILLWPTGILTSAFYIYVFMASKFYADMSLQLYYLVISIYGWITWYKGKTNGEKKELPIAKVSSQLWIKLTLVTMAIYIFIAWILVQYTDSPLPYWDAFTTACSITATWMLVHKYIEQWLVWIVVDAISLGLYIYKGLYPTSVLFLAYTILAIIGYIQWKKTLISSQTAG